MTFKSKIDLPYSIMIGFSLFIIWGVCLVPLFFGEPAPPAALIIIITSVIVTTALLLLMVFDTKYIFYNDYLHVKSWFFGSKIPYRDIYKVNPTSNFLSGYRIMTSKDGVEIHSRSIGLGSVKISPKDKEIFLKMLKKRAPHVKYEDI